MNNCHIKIIITIILTYYIKSSCFGAEIKNWKKYEDTSNRITLQNILSKEELSTIKLENNDIIENLDATYWFKFEIHQSAEYRNVLSTIFDLSEVSFYFYSTTGKSLTSYDLGFEVPVNKAPFISYRHSVPIPTDSIVIAIIRIKSNVKTGIEVSVERDTDFIRSLSLSHIHHLTLFGIFLIATIYSLVFIIFTKKSIYIFYCLYIISFWLCMISINHSTYLFFSWSQIPYSNKFLSIPHYINTLSLIWYIGQLLDLKQTNKKVYYYNILATIAIVLQLIFTLWKEHELEDNFLSLIYLAPSLWIAARVMIKKFSSGIYVFMIILLNMLAFLNLGLHIQDYIPSFFLFSIYGVLDIILCGISISLWLKNIAKQNEKIILESLEKSLENQTLKENQNIILENKVAEKTSELATINEELNKSLAIIEAMNSNLEKENINLTENVQSQIKARSENILLSFNDFSKFFGTEKDCFDHIASIKWAKGFKCEKCGSTECKDYRENEILLLKRCSKCRYLESVTTRTLFHKSKIDILKSFYICYVTNSNKCMTIEALSDQINLRKATTFNFIQKVKNAIITNKKIKPHKDGWSHLIIIAEQKIKNE